MRNNKNKNSRIDNKNNIDISDVNRTGEASIGNNNRNENKRDNGNDKNNKMLAMII